MRRIQCYHLGGFGESLALVCYLCNINNGYFSGLLRSRVSDDVYMFIPVAWLFLSSVLRRWWLFVLMLVRGVFDSLVSGTSSKGILCPGQFRLVRWFRCQIIRISPEFVFFFQDNGDVMMATCADYFILILWVIGFLFFTRIS